jgi:osmotically-inducible protein OsmY
MMKQLARPALAASLLASLLALGACGDRIEPSAPVDLPAVAMSRQVDRVGSPESSEAPEAPDTATMAAAAAPADDPDGRIAAEVKQALATDADLSGMKIDVSSEDGAVTLRGRAPDPSARERATGLARTVREVRAVENLLTLG